MKGFDPIKSWGAEDAQKYTTHLRGDEAAASKFLADYAKNGAALEFAIGTGRIGIPLKERGVEVEGLEGSPEMVAQLHAHPVGKDIRAVVGDMSQAAMGRHYQIVYLVYNTIFNLLTADDQINCFKNAARHLSAEGHFIVETALPHAWIEAGKSEYVKAEHIGVNEVQFDVARYDPVTQLFEENHVRITEDGVKFGPIVCRLITPGEMDLMARIAGLKLVERFANWERSAFTSDSVMHVSVYGKESNE